MNTYKIQILAYQTVIVTNAKSSSDAIEVAREMTSLGDLEHDETNVLMKVDDPSEVMQLRTRYRVYDAREVMY